MAEKKNILTYAGLKQYEDELQNLKVFRRKEVAQKIKEAREQGDLSENAEYDAAKDEQRDIELRIEELENTRQRPGRSAPERSHRPDRSSVYQIPSGWKNQPPPGLPALVCWLFISSKNGIRCSTHTARLFQCVHYCCVSLQFFP